MTLQWTPWTNFPPDLSKLPLASPIAGLPSLVRFHAAHEVGRTNGTSDMARLNALLSDALNPQADTPAQAASTARGSSTQPSPPLAAGAPVTPVTPVTSLSVSPSRITALYGSTYALSPTAKDAQGQIVAAPAGLNYASSDPSVVGVDAQGRVSLLRRGKATVTVSAAGGSISASVNVEVTGFAVLGRTTQDYRCAIPDNRDAIYCWGKNLWTIPLVRTAFTPEVSAPTAIKLGSAPANSRWKSVASSAFTSCALSEASRVYCWGASHNAALGRGTPRASTGPNEALAPAQVSGGELPADAQLVAVGVGPSGACAAEASGRVFCWGSGGVIPRPSGARSQNWADAPIEILAGEIPQGAKISDISVSVNGGCLIANGSAYCWQGNQQAPVRVADGEHTASDAFVHLESDDFTCGVTQAGAAFCVGAGNGVRFGAGSTAFISTKSWRAVAMSGPRAFTTATLGGIAIVNCGIDATGQAWCWGNGYQGALADDNLAKHEAPIPTAIQRGEIPPDVTIAGINCGQYQCAALGSDGRIYGWGANTGNVLGRPSANLTASAHPILGAWPVAQ